MLTAHSENVGTYRLIDGKSVAGVEKYALKKAQKSLVILFGTFMKFPNKKNIRHFFGKQTYSAKL